MNMKKRFEDLLAVRFKIFDEMLQLSNELSQKLNDNDKDENGSSDGLGSASMNMKILELQFTAAVNYFTAFEDSDKEAAEILDQLQKVLDFLEGSDFSNAIPLMHKVINKVIEYKSKHPGEKIELDHVQAMTLIKESLSDTNHGSGQKSIKETLDELQKIYPIKSKDLKI